MRKLLLALLAGLLVSSAFADGDWNYYRENSMKDEDGICNQYIAAAQSFYGDDEWPVTTRWWRFILRSIGPSRILLVVSYIDYVKLDGTPEVLFDPAPVISPFIPKADKQVVSSSEQGDDGTGFIIYEEMGRLQTYQASHLYQITANAERYEASSEAGYFGSFDDTSGLIHLLRTSEKAVNVMLLGSGGSRVLSLPVRMMEPLRRERTGFFDACAPK